VKTFEDYLTSWQALVLQLATIAAVIVVMRLPWTRWLAAATSDRDSPRS